MKFAALSLFSAILATGCANDDPYERMEELDEAPHWCAEERPAYIAVSDRVDERCVEGIMGAVDFWRDQGVTYLSVIMTPDSQLTPGKPWPRFIQVVTTPPEDPGATGDTRVHRITQDCIDSGEMRFDPFYCNQGNTEAHELGHALGLVHSADPSNLMYPANKPGKFGLTANQLAHVR